MFNNCKVLEDITGLSSFDTSNVTNMSWMFGDCWKLKSLDVSHFDTSSVTDMSGMFKRVKAPLDLSEFDTSYVTDMHRMFDGYGEEGGAPLDLSNFDTSSVSDMGAMFRHYNLAALDISSFDTTNVKRMGEMFKNCKYIKELDLSNFDTSGIIWKKLSGVEDYASLGLADMMDGCSRLEKITFGESFDWSYAPTPAYTENTSYLPTPDGQCIQDADGKWYAGSTGRPFSPSEIPSKTAETYYASKTLVPPYKVAFAMYSEDDNSLSFYKRYSEEVPFKSDGQFDGKTISALFCAHDYGGVEEYSGDRPWADYASSIKKVIIVDDGIRPKSTSGWFRGMRNLTSIDVRKLDTSRDTDMYCMFQSCPVRTLDLSSFDTSRATEMGGMLDCPNLRWLKLGDKFSFNGQGTRRLCSPSTPSFANATGLWVSSLDDKTYVSASIPNNVAAAYAAQIEEGAMRTPLDEGMFEVDTETKIYTGSPIEPSVSSRSLEEGADYSVSYGNNIEAGTATVVVAGKGNYSGELEYSFRIDPRQVGAPEAATGLVYSGAEQVGVAPSGEYEVSGGSATSAGDYTAAVSLKDKRNYVWAGEGGSDDLSIAWAIAKAAPSYSAPAVVNATFGQTLGGLELPGGFSWQDDPSTGVGDAGEHEFMATFTPSDAANYNVVRNIPVIVRVSSPNLVVVPQVADLVYTGEFQKAAVPESDFYAVEEICGGIDAGAYEVKLSLKEPSSCRWADDGSNSEKTVTYRILPAQLTDVMITGVPARMEATGSQLAPEPIVTFNGKTLVQGVDYALSYGENVGPGKGTVTVSAIEGGNFTGSATVEFDIEKKAVPAPVFTDVDYTSWYGDAVSYVAERGLITGYSGTTLFGVGDVLTRAQLATILWRNACPDEYASYDPETAVDATGILGSADGMYYTAAANWAVRNGVITGFDREDGSKDFAADDDVSFEQLVTILSRLCATPEELSAAGSDLSAFADGGLASSWSRGAFAWAAAKGLVQGYDEPTGRYLRPGDPVARERVAVVLMRAFEMGVLK